MKNNTEPLIIGIGYKKNSGKSTFAEFLKDQLKIDNTLIIGFEHFIFKEVSTATGVPYTTIEDNKNIFRPILQWWAYDFRRKFQGDDYYWIRQLEFYIQEAKRGIYNAIIIPNIRDPLDAKTIKYWGGYLIHVHRPSIKHIDIHPTETKLDSFTDWDLTVVNSGSLEDLQRSAATTAEALLPYEQSR